MLSVLRLNHGINVTSLHIALDDGCADTHGWMRNMPEDNWISPPKTSQKRGLSKNVFWWVVGEQTWTMKVGACGIQMRLSATPCTVRGGQKAGGTPLLTACLAMCQNFHGRSQVRAKKTGACWQWDQQIRPKWRCDRYNVQPVSPLVWVFLPYKLLSHHSCFCTVAHMPSLLSSLAAESWDWGLHQTRENPYGAKERKPRGSGCSWARHHCAADRFPSHQNVAVKKKKQTIQ